LAKPIAKTIQHQAAAHPVFRSACVKFAQLYHRTEVRLRSKATTESVVEHVKPWTEEKAIEFGSNFIGEFIIFSIAGTILIMESMRSSATERKKQEERDAKIERLYQEVERLKASNKPT
jgi:hypothetical protein